MIGTHSLLQKGNVWGAKSMRAVFIVFEAKCEFELLCAVFEEDVWDSKTRESGFETAGYEERLVDSA